MLTDRIRHPFADKIFNIYHFEISADARIKTLEGKDLPSNTFMLPTALPSGSYSPLRVYEIKEPETDQEITITGITPNTSPGIMLGAIWYITTRKKYQHLFPGTDINIYVGTNDHQLIDYLKGQGYNFNEYYDRS